MSSYECKKRWNLKHPGKTEEYNRRYYAEHRLEAILKSCRCFSKKRGYAPCTATVEEMEKAFTGKCHVCGISEADCTSRLHMDHCHVSGKFRGWLCRYCNIAVGALRNSTPIARLLINYLELHKTEDEG